MAEGKKTRCVLRFSPVAVLLTCILLGDLPSSHGGKKQCYVKRDGTLVMFNQETTTVAAPCKYRLADFTCGDYQVKVTGGSAMKEDGSYSPDTMWVKVVNTATAETVKLRTSLKRIEKYRAGEVDNVWSIRQGTTEFLTYAGYDGITRLAHLTKSNVFEVSFGGKYDEVSNVGCYAQNFSSPGVPVTLCGDGFTSNEVLAAKTAQYGGGANVSDEQFLRFVMLTDTTVTQSKTCVKAADALQGCTRKVEAAKACDDIFGDRDVTACITGQMESGEKGSGEWGSGEKGSGEWGSGEKGSGEWGSGEIGSGSWGSGEIGSGSWGSGWIGRGGWGSGEWGSGEKGSGEWESGEKGSGEWGSGEKGSGEKGSGEWGSGEWGTGEWGSGEKGSGEWGSGEKGSDEKGSGEWGSGEKGSGEKASGEKGSGDWGRHRITSASTDTPLEDYYRDCLNAVCQGDVAPAVPRCV